MKKMKRIAAMTAALLICSGVAGYMPQNALKIGGFTNAAGDTVAESVEINETNFPDENFRKYVTKELDSDSDGILSAEEIMNVKDIIVENDKISDLTGVEYFTALTQLNCSTNQLTSLDVSKNTSLKTLDCDNNQLTALDISKNANLMSLSCSGNSLTSLDVSKNTKLGWLYCSENQLTTLNVSNNTDLSELICAYNQLTSLDVSKNDKLRRLLCEGNQLTSLDVSKNTKLLYFNCEENKYKIKLANNKFDLSTLPTGFDVTKTSEWTNGTVNGNILTVEDASKDVTYNYDCGNEKIEKFTLIPLPDGGSEITTTTPYTTTTTTTTTTTSIKTTTTSTSINTTTTASANKTTTTTASANITTTTTTIPSVEVTLIGDANCDSVVTMADAASVYQSLGNPDKYGLSKQGAANADCCDQGNGITAADALAIQKLVTKIVDELPIVSK